MRWIAAIGLLGLMGGCSEQLESTGQRHPLAILTASQVMTLARDAFRANGDGNACDREKLARVVAIARAESAFNTLALNVNVGGSRDRGLWQINHYYHPSVSDACAYDAWCNAQAMARISSNGTYLVPWATYNGGHYLAYMGQARAAYDSGIVGCNVAPPEPIGADGCTASRRDSCGRVGCACVDGGCSGGYCKGSGCTVEEMTHCGRVGCACVDHQCSGGYCGNSGCTALEMTNCAKFSCACADHQCSGGYCRGSGCTAAEMTSCAKFGCNCVDHQCSGGYCRGTGCTALEAANCARVGCDCRDGRCSGGYCGSAMIAIPAAP